MGRSHPTQAVLPLDPHLGRLQLEQHVPWNLPRQLLFRSGPRLGIVDFWYRCHCCQCLLGMVL